MADLFFNLKDMNMGFIVQERDAHDLMLHLESINQGYRLEIESRQRSRPLRSFSSAIISSTHSSSTPATTKITRAALLFIFQSVEFKLFKELSAETTILAGLEKEFLKYDELGVNEIKEKMHVFYNNMVCLDPKILQVWCADSTSRSAYRGRMVCQLWIDAWP
jgi:hypothetical protein